MIVRNKIWEELRQAKANIICIQRYTDRNRKWSRYFNALIIISASAGTIGGIFKQWVAVAASALVAASTILKSLMPNFIQSEQELTELDRLMDYYSRYLNKLERIWYNNYERIVSDNESIEQLFNIKDDEADKNSTMNKLVRHLSKKEQKIINGKAKEYVERVYFDYGNIGNE